MSQIRPRRHGGRRHPHLYFLQTADGIFHGKQRGGGRGKPLSAYRGSHLPRVCGPVCRGLAPAGDEASALSGIHRSLSSDRGTARRVPAAFDGVRMGNRWYLVGDFRSDVVGSGRHVRLCPICPEDGGALAGEDDAEDGHGAGIFEHRGAFLERRTGGDDIVDEPEGFSSDIGSIFFRKSEGAFEILEAFFFGFGLHLGHRVAGAKQKCFHRKDTIRKDRSAEFPSEEFGLIEAAETQAPRVEWDRDEGVR